MSETHYYLNSPVARMQTGTKTFYRYNVQGPIDQMQKLKAVDWFKAVHKAYQRDSLHQKNENRVITTITGPIKE